MTETDLTTTERAELAAQADAELAQRATQDLGDDGLKLPMLKLAQKTSKAVEAGTQEAGHYINSLTDRDYGAELELIVVYAGKGRFLSIRKSGNTYAAFGAVAPANWPPEYAGKRFDEIPEAEETYKERVNSGEIEWENGPKIQTTRNFIGFVADEPDVPVRLSLKSTATPTADKIGSLLRWKLKAPWHNVFKLGVRPAEDSQGNSYHVPTAELGRETTEDEREYGRTMFASIEANLSNLRLIGDGEDAPKAAERPDAGGGLDVG